MRTLRRLALRALLLAARWPWLAFFSFRWGLTMMGGNSLSWMLFAWMRNAIPAACSGHSTVFRRFFGEIGP